MKTLAIIDKDQGLRQDLIKILQDFVEEYEVLEFSNLFSFQDSLEAPVDIIIVDEETLGKEALAAIQSLRKWLETKKFNPADIATRILLLSHEKSHFPLLQAPIEDCILKPIDKSLFLQKVQIAFHLPEKAEPQFLVMQALKSQIEIGKIAHLTQVSDVGLSIENPGKVSEGQMVKFYSTLFGVGGKMGSTFARTHLSIPEGDHYNCKFKFFGAKSHHLLQYRKNVQLIHGKKMEVDYPINPVVHDKTIVVSIDMSRDELEHMKTMLEEYIPNVEVHSYSSYTQFLAHSFPDPKATKIVASQPKEAAFIHTKVLQVFLDPAHNHVLEMIPMPQTGEQKKAKNKKLKDEEAVTDKIFGIEAEKWQADLQIFLSEIESIPANEWTDFVNYVKEGGTGSVEFLFKNHAGHIYLLHVVGHLIAGRVELQITDRTMEIEDIIAHKQQAKSTIPRVDMLIINTSFILEPNTWADIFSEKIKTLPEQKELPKVILLANAQSKTKSGFYKNRIFTDLIFRPLDRSYWAKKLLTQYLPYLKELKDGKLRREEITGQLVSQNIYLSSEVEILQLSEFGLAIKYTSPIRKDMFIHFFLRSFLKMENQEPILARCYFSEEDSADKGKFICYFVFLGVTDEVFKQIRLWVRENYILTKNQEGA